MMGRLEPGQECLFGFGDQELIPSYRNLLWSKAMVVRVAGGNHQILSI